MLGLESARRSTRWGQDASAHALQVTMDEQLFTQRAEEALNDLADRLEPAAEEHEFDIDSNAGVLAIEFDDPPAKFVVSPNSPVSQVWVSAHMKSFKLGWDDARGAFVLPETGQSLVELMGEAVGKQVGEDVEL